MWKLSYKVIIITAYRGYLSSDPMVYATYHRMGIFAVYVWVGGGLEERD